MELPLIHLHPIPSFYCHNPKIILATLHSILVLSVDIVLYTWPKENYQEGGQEGGCVRGDGGKARPGWTNKVAASGLIACFRVFLRTDSAIKS